MLGVKFSLKNNMEIFTGFLITAKGFELFRSSHHWMLRKNVSKLNNNSIFFENFERYFFYISLLFLRTITDIKEKTIFHTFRQNKLNVIFNEKYDEI